MSDAPNAKRRRTDSTDATETLEQPIIRSMDHWFDDGNIILQIQSTQFRLYKGILSFHSSVFRDMFSIPLPPDEPMLEGCAIVALSGDTVQDWIHLLNAIYPQRPNPPFAVTSFDDRDVYEQIAESVDEAQCLEFSVLDLARQIGLHSVLPTVYLDIISFAETMRKILDDGGNLSPAEQLICFRGHLKIIDLQASTIMEWLYREEPIDCSDVDKCNAGRKAIVSLVHRPQFPTIWVTEDWRDDWEEYLCGSCVEEAKKIFESGQRKCWDQLPSIFGLPDWPELLAADFDYE
ncbi:hypothetical protein C8J57DRAFT_1724778 [Mycena rebaudengoi]|nr:hypothetical protein C8J57DRAFT_1724778 [Mycena rebaudengoi]